MLDTGHLLPADTGAKHPQVDEGQGVHQLLPVGGAGARLPGLSLLHAALGVEDAEQEVRHRSLYCHWSV